MNHTNVIDGFGTFDIIQTNLSLMQGQALKIIANETIEFETRFNITNEYLTLTMANENYRGDPGIYTHWARLNCTSNIELVNLKITTYYPNDTSEIDVDLLGSWQEVEVKYSIITH
jgi:hypothetical protein